VISKRFGPLTESELAAEIIGVDALIASHDSYTAALLDSPAANQLKIIARWGVGYDSIDVPAATRNGIVVTYTPGFLDDTVANYTFTLMLALARRVHEVHAGMTRGEWQVTWGDDVSGKTLGIVGFGRIGRAVARRAAAFNLRVLVQSAHPATDFPGVEFVSLVRLLAESDFISLHAALSPATRGLIGEAQFRAMKPTAYFINTARGAMVDEPALLRALNEHRIAGAALDVFAHEPLPAESPLRHAPNILLSPHQSSCARSTGERVSLAAAQGILDLMNHRQPRLVLNPDVFASRALRAVVKREA
jgi:phosphoglycerate dehydrogenase-like enzyme